MGNIISPAAPLQRLEHLLSNGHYKNWYYVYPHMQKHPQPRALTDQGGWGTETEIEAPKQGEVDGEWTLSETYLARALRPVVDL